MATVFIAGSIKIKHLDSRFVDRIRNVISEGLNVAVGDADGADTSIQKELCKLDARHVVVYCSGKAPRNNVGVWEVVAVATDAVEGTRSFFAAKDRQMAKDADFGLMMWDAASAGTLSNVIELTKRGKKSVVFVNKLKEFITVKSPSDLQSLVAVMSSGAFTKADQKIGLNRKLRELSEVQLGLPL